MLPAPLALPIVVLTALVGCRPSSAPAAGAVPEAARSAAQTTAEATPPPTRLTIGHSALSAVWAPLWVAQDAGLFQREGLEVDIRDIGNGPITLAALASGEAQLAYTAGPSIVGGIVAGADVVIVGGYLDRMPYELVARGDIQSIQDLRGQTIAVNRIAGATGFVVRYLLEHEGLDPDRDVNLLQLGAQGERIAGLRSGLIAATLVSPPFQTVARREGLRVLYDTAQLPLAYSHSVLAAPRAVVATQPDAVRAVLRATAEAVRQFKADQALATRVLAAHLQVDDPELLQATWAYWRGAFSDDLEPRGLAVILKEALEEQQSRAGLTVDDLVDLRLVRELGSAAPRP